MFHFKLRAKFLVLILGILAILFIVLIYFVVHREARLLARKAEEKQQVLAFTIFSDMRGSMMTGAPRRTLELLDNIRGKYGLARLEVLRADGSRAFETQGSRHQIPRLEEAFAKGQEITFKEEGAVPLHTILYPLKNEKECRGCHSRGKSVLGVLLISLSREEELREISARTRWLTGFLIILVVTVGSVLYFLIHKVVLQPLAILHRGAERIGTGDLSHPIELQTRDEIEDLAHSLNVMAGRLQGYYEGLEQTIARRTAEVEEKAKRLYEYGRDMATISNLSTKVFSADQSLDEMLDRFMLTVSSDLGYKLATLCLLDRAQALLAVKRDTGLASLLHFADQSISGKGSFAALVRAGREVFIEDVSQDPAFGAPGGGAAGNIALHIVPVLNGSEGKSCWRAKKCVQTACPAFESGAARCWLTPYTLCSNHFIESYTDKPAYCMTCDVFPVLGVLIVALPEGRPYRREDVSVLRILAAEMGAALENHQLHTANRRLVHELFELHKVTAGVLADPSLDRALHAFTESALKFSGLDACNFWLLSEDGRELIRRAGGCAGSGGERVAFPECLPSSAGVLGKAFTEDAIITEYRLGSNDPTALGAAARNRMPSLLAVPLKTENRSIGVFSVHKKSITPFFDTEIAAFMLLANHVAMAVNVCLLNEELKKQNRELTRSTSLMAGILASMSSGVLLLDLDGTVRLINEAGASLLDLKRDELMNRMLADVVPDARVFADSPVGPYQETEIRRSDGQVPIGFSIADYSGESGEREGVIVVYRDLTEIRALQEKLLSKERFAAMGRVIAGAAHEIRNPLFGISSIGQIFERELRNPQHQELAGALLSETARLNRLVEELLIYGRPVKLALAECDLAFLWDEVVAMHQEGLSSKGIALSRDFPMDRIRAYLDPHQIRQVFLNLFRNAVDATASGGSINARILLEGRDIIFKISDTGQGIPEEDIEKVFDLFFTTKTRGTGLGLGICRKIVEDHGGVIHLESRQAESTANGKGTTVTVKLPYRRMPESS